MGGKLNFICNICLFLFHRFLIGVIIFCHFRRIFIWVLWVITVWISWIIRFIFLWVFRFFFIWIFRIWRGAKFFYRLVLHFLILCILGLLRFSRRAKVSNIIYLITFITFVVIKMRRGWSLCRSRPAYQTLFLLYLMVKNIILLVEWILIDRYILHCRHRISWLTVICLYLI